MAELGSAFLCNEMQIPCRLEHHASYLQSWISLLKGDKKAFFKAASLAQKATELLLSNATPVSQAA